MPNDSKLKSVQGVEIFSSGKWNGDEYTQEDLDKMVAAFNDTQMGSRPPLKLGHDDNQAILQNDGYPAAGWVGKLYRVGQKLIADFVDIPEKIYELLKRGAYKKVSSEIYWGAEFNGQKYDRVLAGVALLGADLPAVSNLSDILAMYGMKIAERKSYAESKTVPTIKTYKFFGGNKSMLNEQELSDVNANTKKTEELEKLVNSMKATLAETNRELEESKKKAQYSDERIAALQKVNRENELEAQAESLVTSGDISPAMRLLAKELLGEEKKLYSVNKKELNKYELLKEFIKLHAEAVKLNKKESSFKSTEERASEDDKQHEAVLKYSKENGVSYKEAYKSLYRGKLNNRD